MAELLAPAGSFEALTAAISNGADAIYLGMNRFGARAYANNFNTEELERAIVYAHLRNVKLYITMNTIVFDEELNDAFQQIRTAYELGADGIIVQDLALFTHIVKNYPKMEAHCSTQMGIDDTEGALLFKTLGAKRIVLAREVPVEKIQKIKKAVKLPIEVFIHGALCVSYSGNCLMSGLIGYRSGNRGRCVGSCRKPYELICNTTGEVLSKSYLLSMKDLCTIDKIQELSFVDSLKIEGRMKEPVYVANVVQCYRQALDGKEDKDRIYKLSKTFNRTYTKGYIFNEDRKNIVNLVKPNNFGYKIGTITAKNKIGYEITLSSPLNQQDIIRIEHQQEDINLSVNKIYDKKDNLISSSDTICYIKIKEQLSIGDTVYKTKDYKYTKQIESSYPKEFKRFALNVYVYGNVGSPLSITLESEGKSIQIESDFILEKALHTPTSKEQFCKQFNRLNDTVYQLNQVEYFVEDAFIPAAKINELRRRGIEKLNEERLNRRIPVICKDTIYQPIGFPIEPVCLSVFCFTEQQYLAAKTAGIEIIYYKDNVVPRNEAVYSDKEVDVLIGGYGGIYAYKDKTGFITDYSFNAVNYQSVYELHRLGAKRVTLSYEINQEQIQRLTENYYKNVGEYPNLECIVYGRAPMMVTRYCPLKALNQCGKCKQNEYSLKDEYGVFPILSHENCTTTILNGKILNLIDDLENIKNVHTFRIQLTKESYEESLNILTLFKSKIKTMQPTNLFNKETDTRGHFNKEIL